MPKVIRVAAARKDAGNCSACGAPIKAGDPYVWFQFRFQAKTVQCAKPQCAPKPADLTRSEYQRAIYALHENAFDGSTLDDLITQREGAVSALEELRDETQEKLDNMPEGLQQGDTGQLLQERIDALESALADLENVEMEELEAEEGETEEALQTRKDQQLENVRSELNEVLSNL